MHHLTIFARARPRPFGPAGRGAGRPASQTHQHTCGAPDSAETAKKKQQKTRQIDGRETGTLGSCQPSRATMLERSIRLARLGERECAADDGPCGRRRCRSICMLHGCTLSGSHMRIFSFISSCSKTESNALAHCAPLLATAGTPIPAVVESPQRKRPGKGVVTFGNSNLPPAANARP